MIKNVMFILMFLGCIAVQGQSFSKVKETEGVETFIINANKNVKSIKTDFIQKKHMDILNKPFVSSGKLFVVQPNKVRWEYAKPFTYTMLMVNNHILIKDGSISQEMDLSKNVIFKEISKVMSVFMYGQMINDKIFETNIYEGTDSYKVHLLPKLASVKLFLDSIDVFFNKKTGIVHKIVMHEKGGDKNEILFINTQLNETLNEAIFKDI